MRNFVILPDTVSPCFLLPQPLSLFLSSLQFEELGILPLFLWERVGIGESRLYNAVKFISFDFSKEPRLIWKNA